MAVFPHIYRFYILPNSYAQKQFCITFVNSWYYKGHFFVIVLAYFCSVINQNYQIC